MTGAGSLRAANYTYNAERGTYEVAGFEYRPIGIILRVTPQVNAQGFIKLTIEPEVSSSSSWYSANRGPSPSTRSARSCTARRRSATARRWWSASRT